MKLQLFILLLSSCIIQLNAMDAPVEKSAVPSEQAKSAVAQKIYTLPRDKSPFYQLVKNLHARAKISMPVEISTNDDEGYEAIFAKRNAETQSAMAYLTKLMQQGLSLQSPTICADGSYTILDLMLRAGLCFVYEDLAVWLLNQGVEFTPKVLEYAITREFETGLSNPECANAEASLAAAVHMLIDKYGSIANLPATFNDLKMVFAIVRDDYAYLKSNIGRVNMFDDGKRLIFNGFHYAAYLGKVNVLRIFVENNVQGLRQECRNDRYGVPLFIACRLGRLQVIRYLLSLHPEKEIGLYESCQNGEGRTALDILYENEYGEKDIVDLMKEKGGKALHNHGNILYQAKEERITPKQGIITMFLP